MNSQEIRYFNSLPSLLRQSYVKINIDNSNLLRIRVEETKINFDEIVEVIGVRDYCILTFSSTLDIQEFAEKANPFFGDLMSQTQEASSLIYSVEYNPQFNLSNMQLNSNSAQPMHTDGHFKEKSPKYLCLYCCEQAKNGGFSQMVFADDVYSYIKSLSLEIAEQLFSEYIEYSRRRPKGGLFKYNKKLFFRRNDGKIGISYNPIMYEIKADKKIEQALTLINYFTNKPSSQTIFRLQPNEMLILDNERVLHGRTSFDRTSRRKLKRLWFAGRNIEENGIKNMLII
ncbi:TauD/TfdA family dioxygenase [Nostoc sp. C110]|uniref:TauD/TfdA family dioxygenase n=1 Tax=Nostoc sp. C110 TaxID=3349876 RepID=UPI00370D257B